jgi:hypothetical protein
MNRRRSLCAMMWVLLGLSLGLITFSPTLYGGTADELPVAEVMISTGGINFVPKVSYAKMELTISRPDGTILKNVFEAGSTPYIGLSGLTEGMEPDGSYTYELRVTPESGLKSRVNQNSGTAECKIQPKKTMVQTGYFRVRGGLLVPPGSGREELASTNDVLHYDDVIITGSLCVGFDCADGESFGFDTIRLKEHNLRIHFDDTSYTASYPTNSWRITINDSTNGGASYFSIDDVDDGTSPFRVEAGAPSNSLYVEDYGRVGLGTSTPVVELHIKDSDTPTTRLEQDSSGGWTPQTWDVAGNESNFFIRDATNGSKLPFRIQPSTPSSTLCLKSDGSVGIGTWSPAYQVEVENTGSAAQVVCQRTDGATVELTAANVAALIGTKSDHPMRFRVNDAKIMELNGSGNYIEMLDGGNYNGTWNPSSSRELKENIHELSYGEAFEALEELNPVKYNYKKNKEENRVGFIAEDVPELVAMKSRKTLGTVDIVAVLTKVVKEQQKAIANQEKMARQQQKTIAELKKKINRLEKNRNKNN